MAYEIRYYGPQYGWGRVEEGPLGPVQLPDLDSVRRLAEDTLQPGHALKAVDEDGWVIVRYAADPDTGEVGLY